MGLIGFDVNVSTITDLSSILSSSTNFAMCREHNGLGNRGTSSRLLDFHIQHVDMCVSGSSAFFGINPCSFVVTCSRSLIT